MLRDRGMKHHATLRKLARSWIRILRPTRQDFAAFTIRVHQKNQQAINSVFTIRRRQPVGDARAIAHHRSLTRPETSELTYPPANDPATPSRMVVSIPVGWSPGMRNRATAPTIRPKMIHPTIAIVISSRFRS
jgi:hypothetical protein